MKNIDFLPARYRENYAARAAVVKRWTMVLGISIIITPLAIYQYMVHASVVQSFVLVEPEYKQAQAMSQHMLRLQEELALARGEAALLAWLSHPWPRTQVLARVHAPLPQSVRLTGIRLAKEPKAMASDAFAGRNRVNRRSVDADAAAVEEARPAAEKDLLRLIDQIEQNDTIVTLTGITYSTTELHSYVALLRTAGLFHKSELRSVESQPGQEQTKAQTFEIRLVLGPGHGVPAKTSPAAPAEAVAAEQAIPSTKIARGP